MKILYMAIVMLFLSMNELFASATIGTEQTHLQSITPAPSTTDVKSNVIPSLVFDKAVIRASIGKNTFKLKQITHEKKDITGTTTLQDNNTTLQFLPANPLGKGIYNIKVQPLKLQSELQVVEPKTTWQEFVVWLCSLVYDDISDCPLCKLACDLPPYIVTKPIHYTFEVTEDAPEVIALESNVSMVELTEYNTTQLSITATYDDNTSEDVTQKATYSSDDSSVDVENGVITTNKEGSATVTVNYGEMTTEIQVEVYEMIEGHLLPHEPDNPDDTLLGVDANNNSVRDEVERWIYKEMPTYHHPEIERAIAFQYAKAYQMTLKNPLNTNNEVLQSMDRAGNCWSYYIDSRNVPFEYWEEYKANLKDKQFNTKERLKTYFDFNYGLKGQVFTLKDSSSDQCDTNIDQLP